MPRRRAAFAREKSPTCASDTRARAFSLSPTKARALPPGRHIPTPILVLRDLRNSIFVYAYVYAHADGVGIRVPYCVWDLVVCKGGACTVAVFAVTIDVEEARWKYLCILISYGVGDCISNRE